ncbi:hypothetical protein BDA96_03G096500 [Sorghum bicolor]|jgi:hypothetical protein|uniref:Uncharacterized protein n=2 Tax=Sorghum bicolor TaxID=4558 RepID=A0A921Q773_SORBI|nr:hypothetical protein BDA96_10G268400 [Sorghum bicolor]KAG0515328.1 hypothetical protein BDA96_10G268700 [Sorghum bicolor]KAG0536837.1 hypothetical protein BDA96_03G096500 [Sorghum bicolor]KXG32023.1 hypothetical protein SORBI_3003G091900 [Sorghum bicolor]
MNRKDIHLRAAEATEFVRGDCCEGHLADGDTCVVERGGKARRADAAAPNPSAYGEEVVVVLPLGGGAVGRRRGGRRDVAAAGAGEPRERGKGREAEEAAAELVGPARGEGVGEGLRVEEQEKGSVACAAMAGSSPQCRRQRRLRECGGGEGARRRGEAWPDLDLSGACVDGERECVFLPV